MAEGDTNPTKALLHIHARLVDNGLHEVAEQLRVIVGTIEADPIRSGDLLATIWRLMEQFPDHKDVILAFAKEA